jgi:hypothetical protein
MTEILFPPLIWNYRFDPYPSSNREEVQWRTHKAAHLDSNNPPYNYVRILEAFQVPCILANHKTSRQHHPSSYWAWRGRNLITIDSHLDRRVCFQAWYPYRRPLSYGGSRWRGTPGRRKTELNLPWVVSASLSGRRVPPLGNTPWQRPSRKASQKRNIAWKGKGCQPKPWCPSHSKRLSLSYCLRWISYRQFWVRKRILCPSSELNKLEKTRFLLI